MIKHTAYANTLSAHVLMTTLNYIPHQLQLEIKKTVN